MHARTHSQTHTQTHITIAFIAPWLDSTLNLDAAGRSLLNHIIYIIIFIYWSPSTKNCPFNRTQKVRNAQVIGVHNVFASHVEFTSLIKRHFTGNRQLLMYLFIHRRRRGHRHRIRAKCLSTDSSCIRIHVRRWFFLLRHFLLFQLSIFTH